ncbi:unnamed protein product [Ixodes pacificus]
MKSILHRCTSYSRGLIERSAGTSMCVLAAGACWLWPQGLFWSASWVGISACWTTEGVGPTSILSEVASCIPSIKNGLVAHCTNGATGSFYVAKYSQVVQTIVMKSKWAPGLSI